ncbi:MAG: ABC transporter ATP-binding protein [Caldilineales bacterium]|nr:ABC transporter ATP-binding protein [Caldilineales bacterium]MCW5859898.1 ABC transporter ATP-binding protein [Caldilineales bacterium]
MSEAIVSLRDLRFCYGKEAPLVLDDLSLAIPKGSVTAILGPNGCGKTTLLHILLGRLQPLRGEIMLDGRDQNGYTRKAMSQLIGLVPQDEDVPFEFSVLEYVVLGRAPFLGLLDSPTEADYRLAAAAIAEVGIDALAQRPVPSLSGGERQLARLARALAQEPALMLMDEPTSHLDISNQGRVLNLIHRLVSKQTKTVVFTTHDPTSAASIADYVILLKGGQTVAAGAAEAVITAPNLFTVYNTPVEVHRLHGRLVVLAPEPRG